MSNNDVVICSEDLSLACELVAGAKEIVQATGGSVKAFAVGDEALANDLVAAGADTVLLTAPVEGMPFEGYAATLLREIEGDAPIAVLVGATNRGKGFAAMVAAGLNAGCSTEVKSIRVEDGSIVCERMVYGGLAVSTDKCISDTCVATAAKLTFEAIEGAPGAGEIVNISDPVAYGAKVTSLEPKSSDGVDLSAAKAIVSFGRGVSNKDDIPMIEELAGLLGCELGCTRPIAEDYHWMDTDRYIGLSGKAVKPQLYFSVGSSGQIQQMAGAQDSRVVVGICNEETAPIFKSCDYGIQGDLYEIVPAVIEELKKIR